ncbi:MAG TPA: diacylglycerol kinase family protein [Phycisphaerae bacterium]|nr:diacylglycerol kinase family protein [Phycisphaerae bacterium]
MVQQGSIQIIVNPTSGGRSGRHLISQLTPRLRAAGYAVGTFMTTGPGDASRFAAALPVMPKQIIVVVGGDGTVREVATSLTGPEMPLIIYPMGTENLVARYFQMKRDFDALLERLRRGEAFQVDVGQVRLASQRVERFILVAGIGFDAEVVRRLVASRRGHISHQDYFWPIWRTFWGYHHPKLSIETDDGAVFQGCGMAFVGNIPRYAVGLKIVPRAHPQDGKLDVCALSCSRRSTLLRHAFNVLLGRHAETSGVTYRQATRIAVTSRDRVAVQLDGDWLAPLESEDGAMNPEFTLTGSRVSFLVAPGWRP